MVRECDIATALIYVAINPDAGQRCFWHGALMIISGDTVNQTIEQVGPDSFLSGVTGTVHQHN